MVTGWRGPATAAFAILTTGVGACAADSDPEATGPLFDEVVVAETAEAPVGAAVVGSDVLVAFVDGQVRRIGLDEMDEGELTAFADMTGEVDRLGGAGLASIEYSDATGIIVMFHGENGVIVVAPMGADGALGAGRIEIDNVCADHSGDDLQLTDDGSLFISYGDDAIRGATCAVERLWEPASRPASIDEVLDTDGTSPAGRVLRVDRERTQQLVAGSMLDLRHDADELPPGFDVVAEGLRNPWRIHVDESTQQLWIGDVGLDTTEEINRVDLGNDDLPVNFGWPVREGSDPVDLGAPIAERGEPRAPWFSYDHTEGQSVILGPILSEGAFADQMVWGDFGTGEVFLVPPLPAAEPLPSLAATSEYRPVHFEPLPGGDVLMLGHPEPLEGGALVRLTPRTPPGG